MHFDVVFVDVLSKHFYDRTALEKSAMGGTEATTIRIAEGLASLGLKVAVIEASVKDYFSPIMGQHCFFFHADDTQGMTCNHYVQLRRNDNPQLFKGSKKYLWLHDVANPGDIDVQSLKDHKIQVIGVSDWHRKNIRDSLPGYFDTVKYIYNPVPDEIYAKESPCYDPTILVWCASPHKGIANAVEVFKEIKRKNDKMQLLVFNPGYFGMDSSKLSVIPGVNVYGPNSCTVLWNVIKKSLCVFYPTEYQETFGCIAAEANALGVPIVTNDLAGLKESVSSSVQYARTNEEVIEKVLDWNKNGRPDIRGQDKFKLSSVLLEWVQLLAGAKLNERRRIIS